MAMIEDDKHRTVAEYFEALTPEEKYNIQNVLEYSQELGRKLGKVKFCILTVLTAAFVTALFFDIFFLVLLVLGTVLYVSEKLYEYHLSKLLRAEADKVGVTSHMIQMFQLDPGFLDTSLISSKLIEKALK